MFIFNNESELKGGSLPEAGCGPPMESAESGHCTPKRLLLSTCRGCVGAALRRPRRK